MKSNENEILIVDHICLGVGGTRKLLLSYIFTISTHSILYMQHSLLHPRKRILYMSKYNIVKTLTQPTAQFNRV